MNFTGKRTNRIALLVVLVVLNACGGDSSDDDQRSAWVTIEGPVATASLTTDSELLRLSGRAFINNPLPKFCSGLNCDPTIPSYNSCPVCYSGTTVNWANTTTGNNGTARSGMKRGECPYGIFAPCRVVNTWGALVCLDPGENQITVRASGSIGSASDKIAVTLKNQPVTTTPNVPSGLSTVSDPGQVTVSWTRNAPTEKVIWYNIYWAETSWTEWDDTLPGAQKLSDVFWPSYTQKDLTNGVTYWIAVSATNCSGESGLTVPVPATPEILPTSLTIKPDIDVMVSGASRVYEAVVKDSLGAPIPDLIVDWASSDETIATLLSSGLPTSSTGKTSATISTLAPGEVTISATVAGTEIVEIIPISVAENLSGVAAITAGSEHNCALMSNGTLKCWGDNEWGQLGDGSRTSRSRPVNVTRLADVAAVTAGSLHTCALNNTGGVKCWGFNNLGQLGTGNAGGLFSAEPLDVIGLESGVDAISAGKYHNCAVTTVGAVKCWGSITSSSTPVNIVGLTSSQVSVTAGNNHSCALDISGAVYCWGNNNYGKLGDGTNTSRLTPVSVTGLNNDFTLVDAANQHTCSITRAGDARCWGANWAGQLGNASGVDSAVPVAVAQINSLAYITAGGSHNCAATEAGAMYCWGRNDKGQLADGSLISRDLPTLVDIKNKSVLEVAAGEKHTCVLTDDGQVTCSGSNYSGQLGDGTRFNVRKILTGVVAQ